MIKDTVTIKETVDFLNSILKIDPVSVTGILSCRISCNQALAVHESVQVGRVADNYCEVGMIGILNGLFGIDKFGWGHISAEYRDGLIEKFKLLTTEEVKTMA